MVASCSQSTPYSKLPFNISEWNHKVLNCGKGTQCQETVAEMSTTVSNHFHWSSSSMSHGVLLQALNSLSTREHVNAFATINSTTRDSTRSIELWTVENGATLAAPRQSEPFPIRRTFWYKRCNGADTPWITVNDSDTLTTESHQSLTEMSKHVKLKHFWTISRRNRRSPWFSVCQRVSL